MENLRLENVAKNRTTTNLQFYCYLSKKTMKFIHLENNVHEYMSTNLHLSLNKFPPKQ